MITGESQESELLFMWCNICVLQYWGAPSNAARQQRVMSQTSEVRRTPSGSVPPTAMRNIPGLVLTGLFCTVHFHLTCFMHEFNPFFNIRLLLFEWKQGIIISLLEQRPLI